MSDVPGIDVPAVTAWLQSHVSGAHGPFTFTVIAGGHSNLTFAVTGADGARFVLRRPPLGHVLASAHDMGREHRIISGLQTSGVPVAPALGYCDDPAVNGVPFYVMGFVDGHVIRDAATATAAAYTHTVAGTTIDSGGVALSTANQLTVSARVQEQLQFCVGTTTVDDRTTSIATSCSVAFTGSAGNTVDMGVLDSAAIYVSGPSNTASANNGVNGAAMVRTNANNGVVISYYPEAGSGTNHTRALRVSGATCTADGTPSTSNVDQCFNSAASTQATFTAGTENFGLTIAGTNCGSTTSYATCTNNNTANLLRNSAYDADAGNAFNDGSASGGYAWNETSTAATIARSTTVVDDEALILKFAGTANITTPTGSYGVTTTYIATATF